MVSTGLRRTRVWGRVVRLDLPVYSDSGLGFGSGSGVGLDLGSGFGLAEKPCVPNPRTNRGFVYQFEEDLEVNWVSGYNIPSLHSPSSYSVEAAIAVRSLIKGNRFRVSVESKCLDWGPYASLVKAE